MAKKTTYTLAYEACEAFFGDTGQIPTIEALKPIIGINSPSIISSAIKDWKNDLSKAIKRDQGLKPSIPQGLQDAVAKLWELALNEANSVTKARADELHAKQTELAAKEAELDAELVRVQQLVNVTEQKFQEEINYLKKEISRLSTESTALTEQNGHYREVAADLEKKNAVLGEEIRQEKAKFSRLETQYDKEHDWALKRIEEEKSNFRQQTHNEMSRLQAETSRSKQALELLQAKCDLLAKEASANQDKNIELERSLSTEKLNLAELTLNEAKLQKELNAKDERIRALSSKAADKAKNPANYSG